MKRRVSSHQLNAGFAQLYYGLVLLVRHFLKLLLVLTCLYILRHYTLIYIKEIWVQELHSNYH